MNVLLDKDRTPINSATEIREKWKQHFHEKFSPPINPDPAVLRNLTISPSEPSLPPLRRAALKSLKLNKSPGTDGLQAEILKVVTDLYHGIATDARDKEYFPKTWYMIRFANIRPISKFKQKSESPADAENVTPKVPRYFIHDPFRQYSPNINISTEI
ncbi:hypothetical protein QYM36_010249 [Artemia franciscana]|uniref:Uncharacterized protein n=1 Tax=Artemia franciscana TaxID=6661 RepID=A0AA88I042_ARTSF|nr:hypothetical protein QYM36_010249 [Artemia franciscana]